MVAAGRSHNPEPLRFKSEVTDFYKGQMNGEIGAWFGDNVAGVLEYQQYGDEVLIANLQVLPVFQRKGVATALVNKLKEEFPDCKIQPGYTTDEGEGFKLSYQIRHGLLKNPVQRIIIPPSGVIRNKALITNMLQSYSPEKLEHDKLEKPFNYGGNLYVNVGMMLGTTRKSAEIKCYRVIPAAQYKNKSYLKSEVFRTRYSDPSTFRRWLHRKGSRGFFHGIRAKYRGKEFVLVGPEVVFRVKRSPEYYAISNPRDYVYMTERQSCDFCKNQGFDNLAFYNGNTVFGAWANMCRAHFEMYGKGLGTGKGQHIRYDQPGTPPPASEPVRPGETIYVIRDGAVRKLKPGVELGQYLKNHPGAYRCVKPPTMDELNDMADEGDATATDGCEVEPDGTCEHGKPSWLRFLGWI